ncbi:MAG: hypothetical protein REI94_17015 [Moraxellaceae bacterium]|nr:hypothetical protein [Moraxellaceae bacterium]
MNLKRRWLAVLVSLVALPAWGMCPRHDVVEPGRVRVSGNEMLIVTHSSSNDDGRAATKIGLDEAIRFARKRGMARIYLQDERPAENYFMDDCAPDHWVYSQGGEIGFEVTPAHVFSVGGHLEECLSHTLHGVLDSWARQPQRDHSITLFMDAIFSNGKAFDESDPYYPDYARFMNIVTYGRAGGEHFPKLTLLETMGIIIREPQQIEYLKRVLPHYERSLSPDYRVLLNLNDVRVVVLQAGRGARPPVLRFNFYDSALPSLAMQD